MKLKYFALYLLSALVLPSHANAQPEEDNKGMILDAVHFWISQSESDALDVFRNAWREQGNTWIDLPKANKVEVQRSVSERIVNGYAPAVMQWNANEGSRELPHMGIVQSIDKLAKREHWADVLPKMVMDRISYNGKVYFAPTNIHAENWLWTNHSLFQSLGLAAPQTWEDIFFAADALQQRDILPISLGGAPWEVSLLFNNILFDQVGADGYSDIIKGNVASELFMSSKVLQALKVLRRVSTYVEPIAVRQDKTWADATVAVGKGKAGMQFMGDWAKGELLRQGYNVGKDFDCALVPGTKIAYFWVVDAFAFPITNRIRSEEAQLAFASIVMDPSNQQAFNRIKGSISARLDVNPTELDTCGQIGLKMLQQNRAFNAQSMAMPAQISEAWIGELAKFFNTPKRTAEETQQHLYQILQQMDLD